MKIRKNLVINFHSINDSKWFEGVILLLMKRFELVDLSFFQSLNNHQSDKGFCHITFDDGDKTFYDIVYPLLKKHNIPATIFVSPKNAMGKENFWFQEIFDCDKNAMNRIISRELLLPLERVNRLDFMNVLLCLPIAKINELIALYRKETNTSSKPFQNMNIEEIREVEKSGLITIGAHTMIHPILKNESDELCYKEITESISELQRLLGHEVKYFAYPNGTPGVDFGDREMKILKENNIELAVSTEAKFLEKGDNKFSIPRIGISSGSINFIKLKLLLGPKWDYLKSFIRPNEMKSRKIILELLKEAKK